MFKWIRKGELAGSKMPNGQKDLLRWLNAGIRAVVVLVEGHEIAPLWKSMDHYLEELRELGFDVYHSPIRDFSAPSLDQCMKILRWISEKVSEGKPVLVHCLGGIGRTGTIAACYLVYKDGLTPSEALSEVRRKIPYAVEVHSQEELVYTVYRFLQHHRKSFS
ncbi:MAG: protein phosphatase [Thermoproteota archaeon]|nr:MAG: protein phosphatase [Candidatus Korarchaeota archaeon]